jgi:hypothetical protein
MATEGNYRIDLHNNGDGNNVYHAAKAHQQKAEGKGVCMREEFERLILNLDWDARRYPETSAWPGQYRQAPVQLAWEAWQAATALQAERVRELEEAMKAAARLMVLCGFESSDEHQCAMAALSATAREG